MVTTEEYGLSKATKPVNNRLNKKSKKKFRGKIKAMKELIKIHRVML